VGTPAGQQPRARFPADALSFLAQLPKGDLDTAVTKWLTDHAPRVEQFRATVERARTIPNPNGAMLSHIAGQARGLLGR
jgi:glutamate dehydrogenase